MIGKQIIVLKYILNVRLTELQIEVLQLFINIFPLTYSKWFRRQYSVLLFIFVLSKIANG